jgi:hypothetical protein
MNFTKPSNLLVIAAALILFGNCKKDEEDKQPSADFITDKTEYTEGETVSLINSSSNAKTYRWTMPDGQTGKSEDATYSIPVLKIDRPLQFKLEAFSENGTKSDFVVKNINVKTAKGKLLIYNNYFFGTLNATITVMDTGESLVTTIPFTPLDSSGVTKLPDCGQAGHPTLSLVAGLHVLNIQTNGPSSTTTVQIEPNQCKKIHFF